MSCLDVKWLQRQSQSCLITIVSAGDVVCNLIARLAALTEHGQLLVQHPLELVGRHVRDALVGLQRLQLVQTPVQLLQGLHCQADIGSFFYKTDSNDFLSLLLLSMRCFIHLTVFGTSNTMKCFWKSFPENLLIPLRFSFLIQTIFKKCQRVLRMLTLLVWISFNFKYRKGPNTVNFTWQKPINEVWLRAKNQG